MHCTADTANLDRNACVNNMYIAFLLCFKTAKDRTQRFPRCIQDVLVGAKLASFYLYSRELCPEA